MKTINIKSLIEEHNSNMYQNIISQLQLEAKDPTMNKYKSKIDYYKANYIYEFRGLDPSHLAELERKKLREQNHHEIMNNFETIKESIDTKIHNDMVKKGKIKLPKINRSWAI